MATSSEVGYFPGYNPLPETGDTIRLLHLELTVDTASMISCRLTTVSFSQRPKYDALSYEWGTDSPSAGILLNGESFAVRSNLLAALYRLRCVYSEDVTEAKSEKTLWVDALCINQQDLEERNRQVRLMPFIYTRAQRVLVWLGHPGSSKPDKDFTKSQPLAKHDGGMAKAIFHLCRDSYWQRIWIIQEIGVARDIDIHFAEFSSFLMKNFPVSQKTGLPKAVSWNEFTKYAQAFPELRPIKLIEEKKDRFGDSHLLINLLRNHREAVCHDPRDKVYGLVGLAIDADDDFPMSYGAPIAEVFRDIVTYQNNSAMGYHQHHDTLEFFQLVGQALKLRDDVTPREFNQSQKLPFGPSVATPVLRITFRLLGKIECLGPSLEELIGYYSAISKWRAQFRANYLPEDRQEALEQNEHFLQMLEEFNPKYQSIVFSWPEERTWEAGDSLDKIQYATLCRFTSKRYKPQSCTSGSLRPFSLKLYQNSYVKDSTPPKQQPSLIGLAPPGSKKGDFICQISGSQRALVLREYNTIIDPGIGGKEFTLLGCAGLAKDHHSTINSKLKRHQTSERATALDAFCRAQFRPSDPGIKPFDLEIDMETAEHLSTPCYA